MNYEHDVFLSYPRKGKIVEQWVLTRFKPMIEDYLANELGRIPRIFVDQIQISPGESWPDRLKFSLARSKCLIAVWTPLYFALNGAAESLRSCYIAVEHSGLLVLTIRPVSQFQSTRGTATRFRNALQTSNAWTSDVLSSSARALRTLIYFYSFNKNYKAGFRRWPI